MTNSNPLKATALCYLLICTAAFAEHPASKETHSSKRIPPRSSACLEEVEKAQKSGLREIDLAPKLIELGDAYRREGATREAIPVYEHALAIFKKSHQQRSAQVLDCQLALADQYEDCGRYDKAGQIYTDALSNSGKSDLYQIEILHRLALVEEKQGKHAQAEQLLKRALAACEEHYGANDSQIAPLLQQYSELLTKMNRLSEASKLTARAKALSAKKQGGAAKPHQ